MTAHLILKTLRNLGYRLEVAGDEIVYRYQGPGKPDPAQVAPLLKALKAHKLAALALLEAETQGDHPPCTQCPWCLDNPWSRYPDLPLWCGYWWDYLRADSGWCYERRHGQVPDPQTKPKGNEPVRSPISHDPARAIDSPLTCFECAHFQASEGGESPADLGLVPEDRPRPLWDSPSM